MLLLVVCFVSPFVFQSVLKLGWTKIILKNVKKVFKIQHWAHDLHWISIKYVYIHCLSNMFMVYDLFLTSWLASISLAQLCPGLLSLFYDVCLVIIIILHCLTCHYHYFTISEISVSFFYSVWLVSIIIVSDFSLVWSLDV